MERTKPSPTNTQSYNIQEEPIVLSKPLLDKLLKQEKPADLISLYTFYYYTAKWQSTNITKATTSYTATGLGWSESRVRKTKKKLKNLHLVEDIRIKNEKTNQIVGHFIKVNFTWIKEKNGPMPPISHNVGKQEANALRTNNRIKNIKKDFPENNFPTNWQEYTAFQKSWNEFTSHRKEIKRPLTTIAVKRLVTKLTKYDVETAILALDKSIDNCWTGVFPESIDNENKVRGNPKGIIQKYFENNKQRSEKFFDKHFNEAADIIVGINKTEQTILAHNLISLYDWFKQNQAEGARNDSDGLTPDSLLEDYTYWLDQQTWIKDKSIDLYKHTHTIFKKYRAAASNYRGYDILTGK